MYELFVHGIPKTKGSKNAFVIPGEDGKKPRAVVVDQKSDNLKRWASDIMWAVEGYRKQMAFEVLEGPVAIYLDFFLPPPKSLPKTRVSYAIKKPDIDKLARAVCDALTHRFYKDDSQIVTLSVTKQYSSNPGCRIRVSLVGTYDLGFCPKDTH